MGLEPTKIGFAGRRLDHFGIATFEIKVLAGLDKPASAYTQHCTQNASQTAVATLSVPRPVRTDTFLGTDALLSAVPLRCRKPI